MEKYRNIIERRLRERKRRRLWARLSVVLSAAMILSIMPNLVQPATTMTTICGLEEHRHGSDCFAQVLSCGQDGVEEHVHSAECYTNVLKCQRAEHVHIDSCYPQPVEVVEAEPTMAEEAAAETAPDAAVELTEAPEAALAPAVGENGDIRIGQENAEVETDPAEHAGGTDTNEVPEALLPLPELSVSLQAEAASAFAGEAVTFELRSSGTEQLNACQITVCQDDETLYRSDAYAARVTVVPKDLGRASMLTISVSVTDSFGQTADAYATLPCAVHEEETRADWERAFQGLRLKGEWAEDLLAVARTQIGYSASVRDFIINKNGETVPWTRYGAWQGKAYAEEWSAAYIAFCLNYAKVPAQEFPRGEKTGKWIEALKEKKLYAEQAEAQPGDIVFFDADGDGKADHAGILSERHDKLIVLEGGREASVNACTYPANDPTIVGYGLLNEAYARWHAKQAAEETEEETVEENEETEESVDETLTGEDADEETTAEEGVEAGQVNYVFAAEAGVLEQTGEDYTVRLTYGEDAGIPAHTEMAVTEILPGTEEYASYLAQAGMALDVSENQTTTARFFDITLMFNGEEIEPTGNVQVEIICAKPEEVPESAEQMDVVHIKEEAAQVLEAQDNSAEAEEGVTSAAFETDSFSVYGIVYTVDFHTEIDGGSYDYSIGGGGYALISELASTLGLVRDDPESEADEVRRFVEEIADVTFTAPELVRVSMVKDDTTIGAIKEALELACTYSVELKEADIAAIDAVEVAANDWALVSLQPFDSEETLAIAMTDGTVYEITVTDGRIVKRIISASGETYEIAVIYSDEAQIPDGAELKVQEILKGDADYDEYYQKAVEKVAGTNDVRPEEGSLTAYAEAEAEGAEETPKDEGSAKCTRYARFFDIQIWADGQKIEPQADVSVTVSLADVPGNRTSDPQVVHFGEKGPELMDVEGEFAPEEAVEEVVFTTDAFSVYAIVVIEDYSGAFTFVGEDYMVKISYTEAAELPLGTLMTVSELEQDSDEFLCRLGETWAELNREYLEVERMRADYNEGMGLLPEVNPVNVDAVRFFDISFTYEGETIEPKVPVQVEITYDTGLTSLGEAEPLVGVAHFAEEGLEMIGDVQTTFDEAGGAKSFRYEQASFSDTGTYVAQETIIEKASPKYGPAPVLRSVEESGLLGAAEDPEALLAAGGAEPLCALSAGKGDGEGDGEGEDNSELRISQAPQAGKTLEPNGDGTYKLALSVTGESDTTVMESVTKSNVLIVMDRSSSMVDNYVENGLSVTKVATTDKSGKTSKFTPVSGTTYYGRDAHNDKYRYFPLIHTNGAWYCTNFSYTANDFDPETKVYANGDIYTGTVQSRMTEEQSALNDLVGELLSKNMTGTLHDGTSLDDIIEISVISFGSTRFNGKSTEVDWTTDFETLMSGVNKPNATSGTNWEDALMYAKAVADAKKAEQPDEDMYILFLTDGEPTAIHGETNGANHYNSTGGGYVNAYKPATDDARALVDAEYKLYGIYTFNSIGADYLKRLINVAYGSDTATYSNVKYGSPLNKNVSVPTYPSSDVTTQTAALSQYFYDASNPSGLASAFQTILSEISNSVAFGRVSVTDGITTDAATTAVVSGSASGFRYSVRGKEGELYSVTTSGNARNPQVTFRIGANTCSGDQVQKKTGEDGKEYYCVMMGETEYKMALATIDEDQLVTWDLSAIGTLMGGCTYTVEFDIWPNQEAYDYVADLNNGIRKWNRGLAGYQNLVSTKGYEVGGAEGYPSIVYYPSTETYAVLTNSEQEVSYSIVKTETVNGETTTTYDGPYTIPLNPPEPMKLEDTLMRLEKVWDDKLDQEQRNEILYDNDQNSREYSIHLLVWKADTLNALNSAITTGQESIEAAGGDVLAAADCYYKDVVVGWDKSGRKYTWIKDFAVAPGLMVPLSHAIAMGETIHDENKVTYNGQTYYILDKGHYYTITEPGIDRHYELNTQIYHPMIIDNVLKQVTIENGVVVSANPLTQLKADNTIKGGINVRKYVKDKDGREISNTDDRFTIRLTMKNKDGTPYTDFDYRVFYGRNNPKYGNLAYYKPGAKESPYHTGHIFGTETARHLENEDPVVDDAEPPIGQCCILGNTDGIVEFELYVGDTLRVINVPSGVTYSVEETGLPVPTGMSGSPYENESITYEIQAGDGPYQSDAANSGGTHTVRGNSASRATVVNVVPSVPMQIRKISEGNINKPMAGVWFKLYYDADAEHQVLADSLGNPIGQTIGTDNGVIVTDEEGKASLGRLIAGDYYLKEIKTADGYILPEGMIPIRIAKRSAGGMYVTYSQPANSLSDSGDGVVCVNDVEEPYFAIYINNNPGVSLPNTGSVGDTPYLLGGLSLISMALLAMLGKQSKVRRRVCRTFC